MRRWGIDALASVPVEQLSAPAQPSSTPNPVQHSFATGAFVEAPLPSSGSVSHDDPIELQLKELRLKQQQHQQRQKKPPKQTALHIQSDSEPSAFDSSSAGFSQKSSRFKPPTSTQTTGFPPAASADLTKGFDPSAASFDIGSGRASTSAQAIASTKTNGRPKSKTLSNPSNVVTAASPFNSTVALDACPISPSALSALHSTRDGSTKQSKDSKTQPLAAQSNWAVGTSCLAKYAADGKFYAAEVVRVAGHSITVSFTEYENEFQTCLAKDLRAVVSKGARGKSAKLDASVAMTTSSDIRENGLPPKQQSERPLSKQPSRKEASLALASELKHVQQPFQKPLVSTNAGQEPAVHAPTKSAAKQPLQQNSKKQMPEHFQEWEKASAAMVSTPSATDSHSTGVALSSVGLVTPLVSLGATVKTPTLPQTRVPASKKPLSAFDLAIMRADERAAEDLQQVQTTHVFYNFFANNFCSAVCKN